MRIERITDQHARDFRAEMVCEHCEKTTVLKTGYDDAYYHTEVIPAMFCPHCGRNRRGKLRPAPA